MIQSLWATWRMLQILWTFIRFRVIELLPISQRPKTLRLLHGIIPTHPRVRGNTPKEARLRLALEALGPIFVKFGQLLATRRDILPAALAEDLAKLQEAVTPFSGAQTLIEQALAHPIGHAFNTFDPKPLAAASVAQVHAATLKDGTPVVIKILRPNIEKRVASDLQLLHGLATLIDRYFPEFKRFHITNVVQQYDTIISNELDLRLEAQNGKKFAQHFADSPLLVVPHVYDGFTRKNLLVLQRTFGIPVDNIDALKARGINLKHLSAIGVEIFFAQVFRDNFFHADMHPGNVHIDVSDPLHPRYISLDCAIVGTLSENDQLLLGRKLLALLRRDFIGVAKLMVAGHWVPPQTDTHALGATLETLLNPLLSQSMAEIEFGPLLVRLFQAARTYDLQALPQFMLLEKTLIHVEGLGKQLDPDLDVFAIGQPLLEAWLRQKLGPSAFFHQLEKTFPRWIENIPQLPSLLENAMLQHQHQRQYHLKLLQIIAQNQTELVHYQRLWPRRLIASGAVLLGLLHAMQHSATHALLAASACTVLGLALLLSPRKPTYPPS